MKAMHGDTEKDRRIHCSHEYEGDERWEHCPGAALTNEQIDRIATAAADKAIQKLTAEIYMRVGKSVLEKALIVIGVIGLSFYLWAQSKGMIG